MPQKKQTTTVQVTPGQLQLLEQFSPREARAQAKAVIDTLHFSIQSFMRNDCDPGEDIYFAWINHLYLLESLIQISSEHSD